MPMEGAVMEQTGIYSQATSLNLWMLAFIQWISPVSVTHKVKSLPREHKNLGKKTKQSNSWQSSSNILALAQRER